MVSVCVLCLLWDDKRVASLFSTTDTGDTYKQKKMSFDLMRRTSSETCARWRDREQWKNEWTGKCGRVNEPKRMRNIGGNVVQLQQCRRSNDESNILTTPPVQLFLAPKNQSKVMKMLPQSNIPHSPAGPALPGLKQRLRRRQPTTKLLKIFASNPLLHVMYMLDNFDNCFSKYRPDIANRSSKHDQCPPT